MATYEDFLQTKDYKLWNNLREICDSLEINESKISSMKDLSEYWEPFLERIFKLGVLFKQTAKLKEIKINWIRPCFVVQSCEEKILIDGKSFEPTKESMDRGGDVFRALRSLVATIYENEKLDATTFKKLKKSLQDSSNAFFKALNVLVTKKFAQELHSTIKQIIKPLRDLVKANYRLFLLEKKEEGDLEITLFQDKKDMKLFTDNLNQFFIDEEMKMKRDVEMDQFDDFLNKNTSKAYYQYNFYSKQRENFTNFDNTSIKKQILQKKFEEGLQALLKYLYDKKKDDFYIEINVNKLFKNLEIIPKANELKSTKFFIGQMISMMRELKERLYEIKINGVSRIKIPVTENIELIQRIKKIYDLHLLIDNLMGDKLKYDQFLFIYNCITLIVESNIKEEITIFKEKNFMEDAIPKYLILSALKNSIIIVNKMKAKAKEKNEQFSYDNYFQIKSMKLGSEDNYIINTFELNESHKKLMTPQNEETMNKLNEEIKEYEGRFWILEEFFDPEDINLWLEGMEMLKDINLVVIDDMRDYILTNYLHSQQAQNDDKQNSGKKDTRKELRKSSSNKLHSQKSVNKLKEQKIASPVMKPKKSNKKLGGMNNINLVDNKNDKSDSEEDSVLVGNNKNINNANLENLRPPFVWNFPIEFAKKSKDSEKKEIRNVDPKNFYKDGRIGQFLDVLNKIKVKMLEYCKNTKPNKWLYFFENVLKIHSITYSFPEKTLIVEGKKNEE